MDVVRMVGGSEVGLGRWSGWGESGIFFMPLATMPPQGRRCRLASKFFRRLPSLATAPSGAFAGAMPQ